MAARISQATAVRLADSYAYCRQVCHQAGSSFPLTFWLLPPHKRKAMYALYAFFRLSDDVADRPGIQDGDREQTWKRWRHGFNEAIHGRPSHPIHWALCDTIGRFGVPIQHLQDVLDGIEQDLRPVRFVSFEQTYEYCWRVAAAVGLSCLPVWGWRRGICWTMVQPPAVAAGIAFQLTNILRDLGEDWRRGRIYLPLQDLQQFDCPPERWGDPQCREHLQSMLAFQIARARGYYRQARQLLPMLSGDGQAIFGMMLAHYEGLLDAVAAAGVQVLERRVRLPAWRQWWLLAAGGCRRWRRPHR